MERAGLIRKQVPLLPSALVQAAAAPPLCACARRARRSSLRAYRRSRRRACATLWRPVWQTLMHTKGFHQGHDVALTWRRAGRRLHAGTASTGRGRRRAAARHAAPAVSAGALCIPVPGRLGSMAAASCTCGSRWQGRVLTAHSLAASLCYPSFCSSDSCLPACCQSAPATPG